MNYYLLRKKLVSTLSFESFGMELAFILEHSIAVFLNVTYFYYLVFLFTEKGKGNGRVVLMTITASAEKCSSWYTVEDPSLIFFRAVPFFDINSL